MNGNAKRRLVEVVNEGGDPELPPHPPFSFLSFPDDIVTYLSYFLPFRIQMMVRNRLTHEKEVQIATFFPALAAALWRSLVKLSIESDGLGNLITSMTKHLPMCRDLKRISLGLFELAPFMEGIATAPFFQALQSIRGLTRVEISTLADGAPLFYGLVTHTSALQHISIRCFTFSATRLGEAIQKTHQVLEDLVYLKIITKREGLLLDKTDFVTILPVMAPNLTTLYCPLDDIGHLKGLRKLTHLYVAVPLATMRGVFAAGTRYDVAEHMKAMIAFTPPLVGPHLMLSSGGYYTTILEYILETHMDVQTKEEIAAVVIENYGYKLDFVHEYDPSSGHGRPVSFINSCLWSWSVCRMLLHRFNPPLVFTSCGHTFRLLYDIALRILCSKVPEAEKCDELRYLLGEPLERAVAAGYKLDELMPTVTRGGVKHSIALHECLKYASNETVKILLSRPDVFGDARVTRLTTGHTLLSAHERFIDELIAAGVDWRVTGHDGLNDLELSALTSEFKYTRQLLALVPDKEFGEVLTPAICAGTGNLDFTERMMRLVPMDRWGPCIRAIMHAAIAVRSPHGFVEDLVVSRLQAEAWLAPIDWDMITEMLELNFDHHEYSTPARLALRFGSDYADTIAAELERILGADRAQEFRDALASAKEREAQIPALDAVDAIFRDH